MRSEYPSSSVDSSRSLFAFCFFIRIHVAGFWNILASSLHQSSSQKSAIFLISPRGQIIKSVASLAFLPGQSKSAVIEVLRPVGCAFVLARQKHCRVCFALLVLDRASAFLPSLIIFINFVSGNIGYISFLQVLPVNQLENSVRIWQNLQLGRLLF
jgi:hypothetical protein